MDAMSSLPAILLMALVAVNGLVWIFLATRSAVQRTPLAALGEE